MNASVDCAKKNSRVAQDYRIEVIADDEKNNAIRIEWMRESKSEQKGSALRRLLPENQYSGLVRRTVVDDLYHANRDRSHL